MTERKSQTAKKLESQTRSNVGRRFLSLEGLVACLTVCMSICLALLSGCSNPPRNLSAVHSYYNYDFPAARESLRADAYGKENEQTILNNTRLGMAALADGDTTEAERALGKSFELLSTAGLNKDKTIGAVLDHEGVKIWKGEPFEQALTYHEVAALYAVMGDWENARAASANALFRLTDFGSDQSHSHRKTSHATGEQPADYTAVDTNFALGFLMQAIGSQHSGAPGANDLFDDAEKINPDLKAVTDRLRAADYTTLLIIDYGKGPTKISYGEDQSLVRFDPQDRNTGAVQVFTAEKQLANILPTCDVNQMAIDARWNDLEEVRKAKSTIGSVLTYGGLAAATYGASRNDSTVALAGLGAMAVGLLTKAGAKADTRYCEFMPASIYLVPLKLEHPADLHITFAEDSHASVTLAGFAPGTASKPRAVYLRVHGRDSFQPPWLNRRRPIYGNDATGVRAHDYPWILGGHDVSSPTREALAAYQANGFLVGMTLDDLRGLYDAEGIHIGSGMANEPDQPHNPSYRHVLEGGTGLFTPQNDSIGYKRIMCNRHAVYQPKSDLVRNLAHDIRVQLHGQDDSTTHDIADHETDLE